MAKFQAKPFKLEDINNGNQFEKEGITPNAINAPIEASALMQSLATNQPNNSEVANVGTPKVEIESTNNGYRFKFAKLRGATGATGARGATGAKGDKGDKGDNGKDGEDGDDGANGKSAYDIWLEQGNTGSEADFLESLKGEKGEKGDKGDPGSSGGGGTTKVVYIYSTIENVLYDEMGNIVLNFKYPATDEYGNIIMDEDGNVQYEYQQSIIPISTIPSA